MRNDNEKNEGELKEIKEKIKEKEIKNTKEIKRKIEATKKYSILDGSAWSVMNAFGNQYITPYALALGATNFMVGIISALSTIAGGIGQFFGAWWLQFEKSRKGYIVRFAIVQSLLWIPIALLFLFPQDSIFLLLILYSISAFFGAVIAPAWVSLMRDIVDEKERGSYFGLRNKICGTVEMFSAIMAGILLSQFSERNFIGFFLLFFIAFLFRMLSAYYLKKHYDPTIGKEEWKEKGKEERKKSNENNERSFIEVISPPEDKNFRNFLILYTGILFGTAIAGPFFAVYMLRDLKFDYILYSISNVAMAITVIITQPYWGKLIDKYGTRPVIFSTAALIPLIPLMWAIYGNFLWILFVQAFSGFVWSGFNLSTFNFIFRVAPREFTSKYSAHANGMNALATFGGNLVGSFLAVSNLSIGISGISTIQMIFIISALVREGVVLFALPKITEGPVKMKVKGEEFLLRVITVYPFKGVINELSSLHSFVISIKFPAIFKITSKISKKYHRR